MSRGVERIVSGGQTGADRGGLDAAIALGIPHGGWCPRGRRAEDGGIPSRYQLRETESSEYAVRTERNVVHSDGTLIISRGALRGGSALTARLAAARGKPHLHVDLDRLDRDGEVRVIQTIRAWLADHEISVLNVAGPRASRCSDIADRVRELLIRVLDDGD